jgi:hypothetical protein
MQSQNTPSLTSARDAFWTSIEESVTVMAKSAAQLRDFKFAFYITTSVAFSKFLKFSVSLNSVSSLRQGA